MEISSGYLNEEKLREELAYIIDFLRSHSSGAKYMYGWACNIDMDKQWKTIPIQIDDVEDKVSELIDSDVFNYCDSDLYIYDNNENYNFLLCHECDVHFQSPDKELVLKVKNAWEKKGYSVHEVEKRI